MGSVCLGNQLMCTLEILCWCQGDTETVWAHKLPPRLRNLHHPSQALRNRHAHRAQSLPDSPYVATYHPQAFILSKLFSQVDKHGKNMTYVKLNQREFLPSMIHHALVSPCSLIRCSGLALGRTLSALLLWLILWLYCQMNPLSIYNQKFHLPEALGDDLRVDESLKKEVQWHTQIK